MVNLIMLKIVSFTWIHLECYLFCCMCMYCVLVVAFFVVVVVCMQGDRGPPGLPGGLGVEWEGRIQTLKVQNL